MAKPKNVQGSSFKRLGTSLENGEFRLPDGYVAPEEHGHTDTFTTIRETAYRGKDIRVETTYRFTIDDEPLRAHVMVLDDGTVHYHGLPNYSFPSAMDLARKIVDMSGFEIPENELTTEGSADDGGHH